MTPMLVCQERPFEGKLSLGKLSKCGIAFDLERTEGRSTDNALNAYIVVVLSDSFWHLLEGFFCERKNLPNFVQIDQYCFSVVFSCMCQKKMKMGNKKVFLQFFY